MAGPVEAPFVYAFAGILALGSAILLFVPLFRHLRFVAADRSVFAVAIIGLVGIGLAAVVVVTSAASEAAYFIPLAAVTVVLRLASPGLLYRTIRERLEARRGWWVLRLLVATLFLGFAGVLTYNLVHLLLGQSPPFLTGLSEQLGMAFGAAFLIVRTAFKLRPRFTFELWPVWASATAFAVAFVVVGPYAFPAFAIAYTVSGLIGWIIGTILVVFFD